MTDRQVEELLKLWAAYYQSRNVSHEFTEQCLNYAKPLFKQDMPVIFDFQHLCLLLGLNAEYLQSVIYGSESHYREFTILQRWIYDNILSKAKVNYCAHGFRPKRSILTNAKIHVENKYLLKLDLKDFFPSIKINQVINVFRGFGYSNHVSFFLGAICCVDGHLPQGAPTSPALSNIIARHLDNRLLGLAKKMGYRYTRYADDLAFSGEMIKPELTEYVAKIIMECGFDVNVGKIKLYKGDGAKILTGVSLANGKIKYQEIIVVI